jgi:hypothetical protein
MIEGINGIISRLNEIYSRIDEIKSITKQPSINPLKTGAKPADDPQAESQKPFSEILKQVLEDNGTLPGLEDNPELSTSRINQMVGSNAENKELLELLYKNIQSKGNTDVNKTIEEAAQTYGVDKSLIKAVIQQESEYNKTAVSNKGAMGLMQLMPQTAEMLGVDNPFDARQNIFGGTRYLKMLMNKYHNDLNLSLAAYNAGPGAVDQYGDVPPYDETQNYVKKVMQYYNSFKNFE